MLETLLEKNARWLSGEGPEADAVIESAGSLTRNLADLPFPARASEDELHRALDRVFSAMEVHDIFRAGQFLTIEHLEPRVVRFLVERRLITAEMERSDGPCGVWVSDDQAMSVMLNGRDHLRLQVRSSGSNLGEVWTRLSHADDLLSQSLDFAFHDRYGYMSASLAEMGTGLRFAVAIHLPGLAMHSRVVAENERARETGHRIEGLFGPVSEGTGDVFAIGNTATLGRSEEEIHFNLQHLVAHLLESERRARRRLLEESARALEDRIGRAWGVARGAHLLEFAEAAGILSSLRLGRATGQLKEISYRQLNDLLYASQPAHLAMRAGRECDDLSLSMDRADLFRATFM